MELAAAADVDSAPAVAAAEATAAACRKYCAVRDTECEGKWKNLPLGKRKPS